jgi:putative restriction endonuclease
MTLGEAVQWIYGLHRNRRGHHESPHKPVMLLAVMEWIGQGRGLDNWIFPDEELRQLWLKYFSIVRRDDDQPNPNLPFYHMHSEGNWRFVMKPGYEVLHPSKGGMKTPSWKKLEEVVSHVELHPGLFALMMNPVDREILRNAVISRYFSYHRSAIMEVLDEENLKVGMDPLDQAVAEDAPGRDSAFRKVITEIYDYRCAACGLRVKLQNMTLIDAAHIIPFSETRDDNPKNGLALCKNHHFWIPAGMEKTTSSA